MVEERRGLPTVYEEEEEEDILAAMVTVAVMDMVPAAAARSMPGSTNSTLLEQASVTVR